MKNMLILFMTIVLFSCAGKSNLKEESNDPFAIFKTPSEKAEMLYVKKSPKEFIYLKGKKLKDYTVVTNDNGFALNLKGHRIVNHRSTLNKSDVIKEIKTLPTVEGSTLDFSTKGKQGFKIYKRKSGLVLALGKGYAEIADDDLDALEKEFLGSSKKNNELDDLDLLELSKDSDLSKLEREHDISNVDKDIEGELGELDSQVSKSEQISQKKDVEKNNEAKLLGVESTSFNDKEDEFAFDESEEIDEAIGSPAIIKNVEFLRLTDSTRLVISTNKPVQDYIQEEFTGRNDNLKNNPQIIIHLQNTYLPKRFTRPLDTSEFPGSVTMINMYQIRGPYRTVQIIIQLRNKIDPEIKKDQNNIYVDFPIIEDYLGEEEDQDIVINDDLNINEFTPSEVNDIEAAKKLSRMNFQDYLAKPLQFYGTRMSLEVAQAEVMDVLRLIQEVSGMNIVVSGNVKGNLSLSLKNVPWDQALSVVLQNAQLGYIRQGSVIRVAPLADLRDERQLASQAIEAGNNLEPLRVLVSKLDYLDAEKLKERINVVLSSRGKVAVDNETNSLIITDIEDNVLKVNKLIKSIDKRPHQIVIESKIIEANESWIRAMGFNWATDAGDIGFKNISGYGNISATIGAASVKGDVRIVSAPRISTMDRKKASIIQGTQVAYKTSMPVQGGGMLDKIEFENVAVELNVLPKVTSKNEIILDIDVKREFLDYPSRSSKKLPAGVGIRKAVSQILLNNGGTAVIGGLYSLDTADSNAGVPWLSKIPIVGWLFGKSEAREMRTELLIFLKATIVEDQNLTASR